MKVKCWISPEFAAALRQGRQSVGGVASYQPAIRNATVEVTIEVGDTPKGGAPAPVYCLDCKKLAEWGYPPYCTPDFKIRDWRGLPAAVDPREQNKGCDCNAFEDKWTKEAT